MNRLKRTWTDDIWNDAVDDHRVLVVGDAMLDVTTSTTALGVSSESSAPILQPTALEYRPGGAANAAANISAAGIKTHFLGAVSGNESGNRLLSLIRDHTAYSNVLHTTTTTVKHRIVTPHGQVCRIDTDSSVGAENAGEELKNHIATQNFAAIVVSDYGKGFVDDSVKDEIAVARSTLGIPTFVDCKYARNFRRDITDYLKINKPEAFAYAVSCAGMAPNDLRGIEALEDFEPLAVALVESLKIYTLIITCGSQGAVWATNHGNSIEFRTAPQTCQQETGDVTGAGDTFLAAFVASKVAGNSTAKSVDVANTAASIAVSKRGTYVVPYQELCSWWHEINLPESKIMSVQRASRFAATQSTAGRKVVMTNGCFDCLHAGHISSMQWAKQQGDVLVVAVNSDRTVHALKGRFTSQRRPIVPASARVAQIAQLDCVDAVCEFDDFAATWVIEKIAPDVLVKSEEYRNRTIPGQLYMIRNKRSILYSPLEYPEIHTSNLIKRSDDS